MTMALPLAAASRCPPPLKRHSAQALTGSSFTSLLRPEPFLS